MLRTILLGTLTALILTLGPAASAAPPKSLEDGGGGSGTCIYYGGYALGSGPGVYCLRNGVWVKV